MECIFCGRIGDFAPEHVFPESIGGRFWISNVCNVCNHKLGGTIDSQLTKHKGIYEAYRSIQDQVSPQEYRFDASWIDLESGDTVKVSTTSHRQHPVFTFNKEKNVIYLAPNDMKGMLNAIRISWRQSGADGEILRQAINRFKFALKDNPALESYSDPVIGFETVLQTALATPKFIMKSLPLNQFCAKVCFELAHRLEIAPYIDDLSEIGQYALTGRSSCIFEFVEGRLDQTPYPILVAIFNPSRFVVRFFQRYEVNMSINFNCKESGVLVHHISQNWTRLKTFTGESTTVNL